MGTLPQVETAPGQAADIKQKVQEVLGDAPEAMKVALENALRDMSEKPEQASRMVSAGRAGSRVGTVSEFTIIAPLREGGAAQLRGILKLLNGNFSGADKVGTLHDMRFLILDNDTKLLFATAYDGDWDAYIDDFATKIPDLMDLMFFDIEGWPGISHPSVRDFFAKYQLTADGWYVANPNLTVVEARRLQRVGTALDEFLDKISE